MNLQKTCMTAIMNNLEKLPNIRSKHVFTLCDKNANTFTFWMPLNEVFVTLRLFRHMLSTKK
jgi:hypothetical protein